MEGCKSFLGGRINQIENAAEDIVFAAHLDEGGGVAAQLCSVHGGELGGAEGPAIVCTRENDISELRLEHILLVLVLRATAGPGFIQRIRYQEFSNGCHRCLMFGRGA